MAANEDINELCELIIAQQEGEMSDEQFEQLNHRLKQKEQIRLYVEFKLIFSELSCPSMTDYSLVIDDDDSCFDDDSDSYMELLFMLAEKEKTAPALEIMKEEPERVLIQKVERVKPVWRVNKASIYTAVISIAAALALVAYVYTHPINSNPYVGFLNGTFEAQWGITGKIPELGEDLYAGPMCLDTGLAEIEFGNGAIVLVEGPAEFLLENDRSMYLKSGKVSARVLKGAAGFTIKTPWGNAVDLGTEFGVIASRQAMTTHVFKGTVVVSLPRTSPKAAVIKKTLTTGQAVMTDEQGQHTISMEEELFEKKLPDYLYRRPISITNHSFEMDGNLSYPSTRVPTGWTAVLPIHTGAENQPKRGTLPRGGYDGEYVGYVNQTIYEEPVILNAMYQNVEDSYVEGEIYTLTVAVGLRTDWTQKLDANWKISLCDATNGRELSSTFGDLKPEESGIMTDRTLIFQAGPDITGHGIQVRLTNTKAGKVTQTVFDNVRLTREMPR